MRPKSGIEKKKIPHTLIEAPFSFETYTVALYTGDNA